MGCNATELDPFPVLKPKGATEEPRVRWCALNCKTLVTKLFLGRGENRGKGGGGGLRRPQCEWSAWTLAESRFCYACLHGRNDYFTHASNHAHSGRSLRKTSPAFLSVTGGSCPEGGRLSSQAARATANLESLQWENTHGCPLYIMLHCFDKRRERKKKRGVAEEKVQQQQH